MGTEEDGGGVVGEDGEIGDQDIFEMVRRSCSLR